MTLCCIVAGLTVIQGCEFYLSDPEGPSPDQILAIDIKADALAANGQDEVDVEITHVLTEFRPRDFEVVIRTTDGELIGGTARGNEIQERIVGGQGTVRLRAGRTTGAVRVTASAQSITVADRTQFVRAPIAGILLTSDVLAVPADGLTPFNLTATVLTDSGRPTLDTPVRFVAVDQVVDVEVRELRREAAVGSDDTATVQMRSLRPLQLLVIAYPFDDTAIRDSVWIEFREEL